MNTSNVLGMHRIYHDGIIFAKDLHEEFVKTSCAAIASQHRTHNGEMLINQTRFVRALRALPCDPEGFYNKILRKCPQANVWSANVSALCRRLDGMKRKKIKRRKPLNAKLYKAPPSL